MSNTRNTPVYSVTCLSCGKEIKNPATAKALYMHCATNEFTDSEEVAREWGDDNQGAFLFGPECYKKVLADSSKCRFEGDGC